MTAETDAHGQLVVTPDPTSTSPGRGAHLHPTTECLDLAVRRKAFGRALRVSAKVEATPVGDHIAAHQRDQLDQITQHTQTKDWSSGS